MRAALLQLNVSDNPRANLPVTRDMLQRAAEDGAELILTPEVTNCIATSRERQRAALAEEAEDQTLAALREDAARHGVHLLIGSLALLSDDPEGRFVNRSFLIGPDGAVMARYDKIHMFDVAITKAETYRESAAYRPGARAVLVPASIGRIGMCICYDMRFPRLSDTLARAGADILTYPSAFSPVSGAAHWHTLLRARAIETGCWVLAAAQTGTHPGQGTRQRSSYGHSLAVDPWGEVVLDAETEPGVYAFDMNIEKVVEARRRIPALQNARKFDGP